MDSENVFSLKVEISELLQKYFVNKFLQNKPSETSTSDQDSINFWESMPIKISAQVYDFTLIKSCFPQLNFPIKEGVNNEQTYKNAVLKGDFSDINFAKNSLGLQGESEIRFEIYESFAGKVLVLTVPNKQDFEKIIQSMLYKNRPVELPKSMGASLINGINNWGRIQELKKNWEYKKFVGTWGEEFKNNIVPFPEFYKDKIVVLSRKPYSNVSAQDVGLSENEWLHISHKIRLEHECAHQYTLMKFGSASNNLHDELIADYVGIVLATGAYKKDWMLKFMGIESFPTYRNGARLENYIPGIEKESAEFEQLTGIIIKAIENISVFDTYLESLAKNEIKNRIDTLCNFDVLTISSEEGSKLLINYHKSI